MADRAKKLAAAKKRLKEYRNQPSNSEDGANITNSNVVAEPSITPVLSPEPVQIPIPTDAQNVIEMLISEKSQIAGELAQYKVLCRQRDQELQELQSKLNSSLKRTEDVEISFSQEQKLKDELQDFKEKLTREVADLKIELADKSDYIEELKNCLFLEKQKLNDLEIKESEDFSLENKTSPVENAADTRIESLMQTKFMYEQQIRDLQAMVQQFTQDKEQLNQQFQNYVSHLNQEISSVNEKNTELLEQVSKLEVREKSLVDHISGLEKQIQQNLRHQQQQTENNSEENQKYLDEIAELKSQLETMNEEKMVFQLKIKSQENKFEELAKEKVQAPQEEIVERVYCPEEDKKLLEIMESDKIAASRALIQNVELKQQLDELQMKFIELTNDKVELMTKLDSEIFLNKDIRQNHQQLKDAIDSLTEKLHYKDEEMIRLSHENNDLKLENMELKHGKLKGIHYEEQDHGDSCSSDHHSSCSDDHQHESSECHHNDSSSSPEHNHKHETKEDHSNGCSHEHKENDSLSTQCEEVNSSYSTSSLRPEAAMRKLEARFTKLMLEVADLTDDKQRLEHLVLQLQGETETIGEYISLYQTQRRILKQRDYDRNNYLQKIESERQELLKKMDYLNQLLAGLGIQVPFHNRESIIEPISNGLDDRQQVLQKIQSIIHEMQEKSIIKDDLTKCGSGGGSIAIDHCLFCSGDLETV